MFQKVDVDWTELEKRCMVNEPLIIDDFKFTVNHPKTDDSIVIDVLNSNILDYDDAFRIVDCVYDMVCSAMTLYGIEEPDSLYAEIEDFILSNMVEVSEDFDNSSPDSSKAPNNPVNTNSLDIVKG